jgi:hypothetical protein
MDMSFILFPAWLIDSSSPRVFCYEGIMSKGG